MEGGGTRLNMVAGEGRERRLRGRLDDNDFAGRWLRGHLYPIRRDRPFRTDAVDHARHDVHPACVFCGICHGKNCVKESWAGGGGKREEGVKGERVPGGSGGSGGG